MIDSNLIYPQKYKLLTIYKISVVVLFLISLKPLWFWGIPHIILTSLCAMVSLLFLIGNAEGGKFFSKKQLLSTLLLLITLFYTSRRQNIFGFINTLLFFFNFYTILSLRRELKIDIVKFVGKCYALIILVSLIFYFLKYAVGVPLPSNVIIHNDVEQYTYNNYKFFLTLRGSEILLFPRFQSIFVEPGHLGMIASFFLYVFSFNLKKWYNVVLLIGSIFSLSLAAYILIATGLVLKTVSSVRKIIIGSIFLFLFGLGAYHAIITYNRGNNILNQKIIERLVIVDGDLAGNNRTTESFDHEFHRAMRNRSNLIFGKELDQTKFSWGNSSYAVFIYQHGLLGLFLVIILYLSFMQGYSFSNSLRLFLIFSASFLQRPYALWTSELLIFICGLAMLELEKNSTNNPKKLKI